MGNVMDIRGGPAIGSSTLLRDQLRRVRARLLAVSACAGVALMASVAVVALAVGMAVDWWVELPLWTRALALAAEVSGLAALLIIHILRPALRQPDDDAVALMVEKRRQEFGTRLIAAIQLARPGGLAPGASTELVKALVAETEALAQQTDLRSVIPAKAMKKRVRDALILLALAGSMFAYTREISLPLLRRALLADIEVPRKTHVEITDGNKLIGRGDSVTLAARARGFLPRTGALKLTFASGHNEEITLTADAHEPRKFSQTIENVQDSFTYRVKLFDGSSPRYEVKTVPRPEIAFLECRQIYPAYTGLGTVRRALGDLVLLAGSKLEIQATATKNISRGTVKQAGLNQELPMTINPQNPRQLAAVAPIPLKDLTGFSVTLVDTDGIQSRDPAMYRIDIVPDKLPTVRITFPERKEELVTPMAALLIGVEAADDFAIGKVVLHYKVDTMDKGAEKTLELDLGNETPKSLRRRFEWQLRDWPSLPAVGSLIEYWFEAVDTNNETGPGTGVSEHYVARVVTEAEKRADLLNRVNDYLGGITEVANDQERLNQALGAIIKAKP